MQGVYTSIQDIPLKQKSEEELDKNKPIDW